MGYCNIRYRVPTEVYERAVNRARELGIPDSSPGRVGGASEFARRLLYDALGMDRREDPHQMQSQLLKGKINPSHPGQALRIELEQNQRWVKHRHVHFIYLDSGVTHSFELSNLYLCEQGVEKDDDREVLRFVRYDRVYQFLSFVDQYPFTALFIVQAGDELDPKRILPLSPNG